jgi:hypothetical protein
MEYDSSDGSSGEPEIFPGPPIDPQSNTFKITSDDAEILNRYIDQFQHADTPMRSRILEVAMGELCKLRPGDTEFNKRDAKEVCVPVVICVQCS